MKPNMKDPARRSRICHFFIQYEKHFLYAGNFKLTIRSVLEENADLRSTWLMVSGGWYFFFSSSTTL